MYLVAIGWLYVVTLMSLTETSVTAGILTFIFFGFAPCALMVWLFGAPVRRRTRTNKPSTEQTAIQSTGDSVPDENVHQHDGTDTKTDQRKLRD